MKERTSDGRQLMGTREFFHALIATNVVGVSYSNQEIASKVNLRFEETISVVTSR